MDQLAYQPRRPVPWKGIDVALLLIVFLLLPFWVSYAAHTCFHTPTVAATPAADAPLETIHPLGRMLSEGRSVWPLLLGVLVAIVLAPISEELVFRLLLQGWLESLERRLRRQLQWPRRILDAAPITIVATLFAVIHYRPPMPRRELSTIIYLFNVQAVASLLTIVVVVCWLRFSAKATLADFGFDLRKLPDDFRLGLLAAFPVIVPTYAAMVTTMALFPSLRHNPCIDPLFLLPLAAMLGFLYYRTHRISPSIALHMTFNAVATLVALLAGQ